MNPVTAWKLFRKGKAVADQMDSAARFVKRLFDRLIQVTFD